MRGSRFLDKVRLTFLGLFDSIPRTLLKKFPLLERCVQRIKENLVKGTMINFEGSRFYCVDRESIFILSHHFESWMWKYIYGLDAGSVFIDVGAHIGRYTIPSAKRVGDGGLVIAIEPHPENYEFLLRNIKLNGLRNVIALNIAAWSSECNLKLFVGDMHGHHSAKKDFGLGSVIVKARPLDEVLNELGVNRVDFIKIDVEGSELEVLKGLTRTLKRFRPKVIVEIWEDPNDVERFLSQIGYKMRQIAPQYYLLDGISHNIEISQSAKMGSKVLF